MRAEARGRSRRALLRDGGLLAAAAGCGLLNAAPARAAVDDALFRTTAARDALHAIGCIEASDAQIVLSAPGLAENGAVVPVEVISTLPGTHEISLVVESNPQPLVARFTIEPGTEPFVSTRIKMAESSRVYAVVRADGKLYSAFRDTKVIVGGCG